MTDRVVRCGTSNNIYNAAPARPMPEDLETVRLTSRLHLGAAQKPSPAFRVVARLADGSQTLVCLGRTRQEAVSAARALRHTLPAGAGALRLERWTGAAGRGCWQDAGGLPGMHRGRRLVRI